MTMQGSTNLNVASIGAGLERGRVGVGVAFGIGSGLLHLGIEEKRLLGQVVADKADDDGVPENGRGARKSVEQLAGEVGLAFLAELAEARTDCGGFELRKRDGRR